MLPKVLKVHKKGEVGALKTVSASMLTSLGDNPILWKIKYINREIIETTVSASAILGRAFHHAMNVYNGGSDEIILSTEDDALHYGLEAGLDYIKNTPEGFIEYNTTIKDRQTMNEKFAFCYMEYLKGRDKKYIPDEILMSEEKLEHSIDVEWQGTQIKLGTKLVGYNDLVYRKNGKLYIKDYKTVSSFSSPDKIDGRKMVQAVVYYLLVTAELGESPEAIIYEEVKHTKSRDGIQVKNYEMPYNSGEMALFFSLFFRLYEDIHNAIAGNMVYIPNFGAMWNNEIALVAYIHRLDDETEVARLKKETQLSEITDILNKKIATTENMGRFLQVAKEKFITSNNIDYSKMEVHEKIKFKLAEHGMPINYVDTVHGFAVDLYRFEPSIGIKMSRIRQYVDDVQLVLGRSDVRILAPIPNTTYIGFEVPKSERTFTGDVPKAKNYDLPIGINQYGDLVTIDLTTAPHILIAGTTGSGKSEMVHALLQSLGSRAELWLADPKAVELHSFKSKRYAEEPEDIRTMLEDLTLLMESRYQRMKANGERLWTGKKIVCVIDEYGDFIIENPKGRPSNVNYDSWTIARLKREFKKRTEGTKLEGYNCSNFTKETFIDALIKDDERTKSAFSHLSAEKLMVKLSAKARASGIHLIISTQRPDAKTVTGKIKANFSTRICLKTASELESRIILDQVGGEKLLGKGDALVLKNGTSNLERVQAYSSGNNHA